MVFICGHSAMSAIITEHFTTRSIDDPALVSVALIYSSVCLVSASMPPATSLGAPSTTADPICPDRNRKSPARTAEENGYGHGSVTLMNTGAWGLSDVGACTVHPAATPASSNRVR